MARHSQGHDHDGERSRYHGPNPTRALAPLAGLLLLVGFTARATGHDPVSLVGDAVHWLAADRPAPVSYLPEANP